MTIGMQCFSRPDPMTICQNQVWDWIYKTCNLIELKVLSTYNNIKYEIRYKVIDITRPKTELEKPKTRVKG